MKLAKSVSILLLSSMIASISAASLHAKSRKSKDSDPSSANPYADYVWPPPPDDPKVVMKGLLRGRIDIEAESKLRKALVGVAPKSPWDRLVKPFAVAFDGQGRILVTDTGSVALVRFDREGRRFDVLGTQGATRLKLPLGLFVASDETIFVADAGQAKIVAMGPEGDLRGIFGRGGELENPTDSTLGPDEKLLYVADSKAHRVVVFDRQTRELVRTFGERGEEGGQFAFPTSLVFNPEGELIVVDQLNSRVQILTADGEFLDELGSLGVGFAQFVRPKDLAIGPDGLLLVSDNAFNNVQIFDQDLRLLSFVGEGGSRPGQFLGISGVAVRGSEIAVVDQLGARLQIFEFLDFKDGE